MTEPDHEHEPQPPEPQPPQDLQYDLNGVIESLSLKLATKEQQLSRMEAVITALHQKLSAVTAENVKLKALQKKAPAKAPKK
jgi:uncharacterized coiled-coil protein SlyX